MGSCCGGCTFGRSLGPCISHMQNKLHIRLASQVRTCNIQDFFLSNVIFCSPRDSITISRAFHDATTLVDITTSLPRSVDEPAYLRPSPPFVRSHVHRKFRCLSRWNSLKYSSFCMVYTIYSAAALAYRRQETQKRWTVANNLLLETRPQSSMGLWSINLCIGPAIVNHDCQSLQDGHETWRPSGQVSWLR